MEEAFDSAATYPAQFRGIVGAAATALGRRTLTRMDTMDLASTSADGEDTDGVRPDPHGSSPSGSGTIPGVSTDRRRWSWRKAAGTAVAALPLLALTACGVDGNAASASTAPAAASSAPPAATAAAAAASKGAQAAQYAWVQLIDGGRVSVRAVSSGASCPTITVNGSASAMPVRAAAGGADFPVAVCEQVLTAPATSIDVAGIKLPIPLAKGAPLDRLAILGDSGCRLEPPKPMQDCNNSNGWPAHEVSAEVATRNPALIIHTGDYYYRMVQCPAADQAKCGGSPHGPTWDTLEADFFEPYKSSLGVAPWIFLRGNHETCQMAGDAFLRLFAAGPYTPGACSNFLPPYAVDAGDQRFVVFDDSDAADDKVDAAQVSSYTPLMQSALALAAAGPQPTSFLLLHRPIWLEEPAGKSTETINLTMQEVANKVGDTLPGVEMVVSGHIHGLGYFSFAHRPTQVISGGGGAEKLSKDADFAGTSIAGAQVAQGLLKSDYGYTMVKKQQQGWSVDFETVGGGATLKCTEVNRFLKCL